MQSMKKTERIRNQRESRKKYKMEWKNTLTIRKSKSHKEGIRWICGVYLYIMIIKLKLILNIKMNIMR